jgi:hypothetical protein
MTVYDQGSLCCLSLAYCHNVWQFTQLILTKNSQQILNKAFCVVKQFKSAESGAGPGWVNAGQLHPSGRAAKGIFWGVLELGKKRQEGFR